MLVLSSEVISGFLMVYRLQCGSWRISEGEGAGLSLAVVRDLRDARAVAGPGDLAALETDVLAADRPPGVSRHLRVLRRAPSGRLLSC